MSDTFIPEVSAGGDEVLPPQPAEQSEEQVIEEVSEQLAAAPEPEVPTHAARSPQQSWRDLRVAKEQAEAERDEAMRILRQIELQKHSPQPAAKEEEDIRLGPDELAEGKHLSQVDRKIKKLEEQLWQYQQKTTEMTAEATLRSKYPDFEKIVSNENIKQLKQDYPSIAETLSSNPNVYSKAEAAYQMIKKLGIHVEDVFQNERAQVQKNLAKPKPIASLSPQQGDSPMSKANAFANGLTPELQKQLLKEMSEARRNL